MTQQLTYDDARVLRNLISSDEDAAVDLAAFVLRTDEAKARGRIDDILEKLEAVMHGVETDGPSPCRKPIRRPDLDKPGQMLGTHVNDAFVIRDVLLMVNGLPNRDRLLRAAEAVALLLDSEVTADALAEAIHHAETVAYDYDGGLTPWGETEEAYREPYRVFARELMNRFLVLRLPETGVAKPPTSAGPSPVNLQVA